MTESTELPKKRRGLAIASLVCAVLGGYASTLTIPAIICGHIALVKIKRQPTKYGARTIAIIGLVLGYLGLSLALLLGVMRGALRAQIENLPTSLIQRNTSHGGEDSIPTLMSMMGKDIRDDEIQAWMSRVHIVPTIKKENDFTYYQFRPKGMCLSFDVTDKLKSVHLYSEGSDGYRQYKGELPFGLSFQLSRREVESVIGKPEDVGGGDVVNYISFYTGCAIEYNSMKSDNMDARIRIITFGKGCNQ